MGEHTNPKCNQLSGASLSDHRIADASDVAAEAMRKRAERRASERAYKEALAKSKSLPDNSPQRWLSNDDLA